MSRIIDYQLIFQSDGEDIESLVVSQIADGWQPLGGVAISRYGSLIQAMVRYQDIIKPADFGAVKDSDTPLSDAKIVTYLEFGDTLCLKVLARLQTKFHSRYKSYLSSKDNRHHASATKRAWLDVNKEIRKLQKDAE